MVAYYNNLNFYEYFQVWFIHGKGMHYHQCSILFSRLNDLGYGLGYIAHFVIHNANTMALKLNSSKEF